MELSEFQAVFLNFLLPWTGHCNPQTGELGMGMAKWGGGAQAIFIYFGI